MEVVKKGLVFAAIRYAVLKFTYHWCFVHAQLKLWNCLLASFCFYQICIFQVVTVLVETHLLLHISIKTFRKSLVTRFLTVCKIFHEYFEVFISYRHFSRWNMVFYVLSQRMFDYNFKNKEATGFIVSGLFCHMSINITAKFLFY